MIRQGVSAELIASRWNISREELDQFSLRSHIRAADDISGRTKDIVAVNRGLAEDGVALVCDDEGVRPHTKLETLSNLDTVFKTDEMSARYPEINWSLTAASSSPVSDGASALLIMEEQLAMRLNLTPRAAITHFSVVGDDPIMMLTAIIPATKKLLRRSALRLSDIDAYEVNEAFASIPLAWLKELDGDPGKINQYGGAIALGHPVGASGGRLIANMLRVLEDTKGRYGLITMCESGGMANATLIENLT